jgi:hypothetical protein
MSNKILFVFEGGRAEEQIEQHASDSRWFSANLEVRISFINL